MERDKNNRGRSLCRSCAHVNRNTTEIFSIWIYGVFKRKVVKLYLRDGQMHDTSIDTEIFGAEDIM